MTRRRDVLRLVGGGSIVAATGGCAVLSGPSEAARAPWRRAGGYAEFRRRALSYAILAPNPHNRQPWLVRLDGTHALTLHVDLDRRLPVTDPFDRQITIGCGAFLEVLALAAARDGYRTDVAAFPEGEDRRTLDRRPIAHVRFVDGGATQDPLFEQVLARRTTKEVFEPRDVAADDLARLAATGQVHGVSATAIGNTALAEKLRDLTWRAHVREATTPKALQESIDLMRIGAAEVEANPDGIRLEGAMIEFGRIFGLIDRKSLADPGSSAFRQGMDKYRGMAMSARAFGWLANDDRTRKDQLDAGRAYLRLNLEATRLGLALHPWSQALQEYPEMDDIAREAQDLIGTQGRLQMLFRIGHAKPVMAAPRRGLEAHLV
jgi:hypothetical protein